MTAAAISIQHLQQGYRGPEVLHDVSLTVPAGQTFALLGRNGAGKTTLIRTLLGVLKPRAGGVRVLGLDPGTNALEVRRRVGYLAEDQTMYGWMTARSIGRFLGAFYPSWDAALLQQLLDQFEVPQQKKIRQLSKGQNIRLGLALALAHRPELVILDDPALGLDPIARKQFNRDVIDLLQSEGRTVLYSSHLLDEVEPVADAVAILDQGRFVKIGSTESVQQDVKRFRIAVTSLHGLSAPLGLLDVVRHDDRLEVIVDGAAAFAETLTEQGIDVEVEDLSLDEIFEAFVIGRRDWRGSSPSAVSPLTV